MELRWVKKTDFIINTLTLKHVVYEGLVWIFLLRINNSMDAVEMINHRFCTLILGLLQFCFANLAGLQGNCADYFLFVIVWFKVAPYPTCFGCLGRSG